MNIPNYYAILTADVRYCQELSAQEKLLFAEITALSNKDGSCTAGNDYFSKLYNLTSVSISRQISALEKAGFIRIDYERKGTRVTKRYITINKNVNGIAVAINKNVNRAINKNVKENNTSILTLQDNNNICDAAKKCTELFIQCLKKNNPNIDRSEKQKTEYAIIFEELEKTYSWEQIARMIKYATSNNFWKPICLSAKKIKQHSEQLYIQMASKNNPVLDCDRVENVEVDF